MPKNVVLLTGANGEMGRALVKSLARHGAHEIVALDLAPPRGAIRQHLAASYVGSVVDGPLLDRIASAHEFDVVFHLAALLSTRGEAEPERTHQVNVDGMLNVLRIADRKMSRTGRPIRFVFPSSIAVYGMPSADVKRASGRVREEDWNVPTTMYGCNKLYGEHLGRYYAHFVRRAPAEGARVDFRALRFPGIISAETLPTGGTSDFAPEMIHSAARGVPYECFVEPEAQIPFMVMPDAVRALVELAGADRERLSSSVYNVGAFSVSASQIADSVRRAFPGARIDYRPDAERARIVASWPEDVDDGRARADWLWRPEYDWERAFDGYLSPIVRARYRDGSSPPSA